MVIFLGFRWWYSAGWLWIFEKTVTNRANKWIDYFSMPSLFKTLFAPFKQTRSARRKKGIDAMVQSAIDNFVSRIIGFFARTFLLVAGTICLIFVVITGVVAILVWPTIPMLPIISVLLSTEAIP